MKIHKNAIVNHVSHTGTLKFHTLDIVAILRNVWDDISIDNVEEFLYDKQCELCIVRTAYGYWLCAEGTTYNRAMKVYAMNHDIDDA